MERKRSPSIEAISQIATSPNKPVTQKQIQFDLVLSDELFNITWPPQRVSKLTFGMLAPEY